jgi:hypothetical protein
MPTYLNPKSVTVVPRGGGWTLAAVAVVTVEAVMAAVAAIEKVLPWLMAATAVACLAAAAGVVAVWRRHRHIPTGIHQPLQPSRADYLAAREQLALEAAQPRAIKQARVIPGQVLASRDKAVR